jgi:hypothetical protein
VALCAGGTEGIGAVLLCVMASRALRTAFGGDADLSIMRRVKTICWKSIPVLDVLPDSEPEGSA